MHSRGQKRLSFVTHIQGTDGLARRPFRSQDKTRS
jgi:hypothetical protein